jgi:hypothetical protein
MQVSIGYVIIENENSVMSLKSKENPPKNPKVKTISQLF